MTNCEVKAVIGSADEVDVLANPFGAPNNLDVHGQYFAPDTNFHEDAIPLPPATHYHNYDTKAMSPAGEPQAIGKAVKRWVDGSGVWYRVKLDANKPDGAKLLDAARVSKAAASGGVVRAFHRVTADGKISHWLNGEIALMDLRDGVTPANRHAIVLPAGKLESLYAEQGLKADFQNNGVGLGAMSSNEQNMLGKIATMFVEYLQSVMSAASQPQLALPPTSQPEGLSKPVDAETRQPQEPEMDSESEEGSKERPMEFGAGNKLSADENTEEENVTEAELRKRNAELEKHNFELKALMVKQRATTAADGFVRDGKILPAQKAGFTELYAQLCADDEVRPFGDDMKFASGARSRVAQLESIVSANGSHGLTTELYNVTGLEKNGDNVIDITPYLRMTGMGRAMVQERETAKGS